METSEAAAPDAVTGVKKQDAPETSKPTVGDIISDKDTKTVPEAAFLELKNANKELKRELKGLQDSIKQGASKEEVTSTLDDIADEYGVDKKFLKTFASAIRKEAETEAEKKFSERLKPFEEKDKAQQLQERFSNGFKETLAEMPEYDGIVNKDVIFALSLNPANAKKTLAELVEDTYGNAIKGKKSIETATHRAAKDNGDFDPARANTDHEYLKQVLADPELKKKYREWREKNR